MQPQKLDILLPLTQLQGITLTEPLALAFEQMKKCRTPEKGGRVYRCPDCGTKVILYNPCNKRGCPICYRKHQIQWQKKTERKILPVTHYHLNFSVPTVYTGIWLRNKNEVMSSLFIAARDALSYVSKETGLLLGSVLVFQSHGRGMSYKPHIHCVLSGGGLDKDNQWINLQNIPTKHMELITKESFEREINRRLHTTTQIIEDSRKAKDYRIYMSIHKNSGKNVIAYLSKSQHGVVIDMEQVFKIEEDSIVFKEADYGSIWETRLLKKTFIERYLNHIPPDRAVVKRYYGLYSNRHSKDLKKARSLIGPVTLEEPHIYKERCPICNQEMELIEVIPKNESYKFRKYGREQGPPKHKTVICVA